MRGEIEKLLRRDDLSPWQLLGLARFIATQQELSTTERTRCLLAVSVRLERHAAEVVGLLAPPPSPSADIFFSDVGPDADDRDLPKRHDP